jgi:hypothetical protein
MEAEGPRQERETILNYNEGDENCSIWTASGIVYRNLMKRLGPEYLVEDGPRHAIFVFPAKWVRLPSKRVIKAMSEAQKAALAKGTALRRQKSE